MLRIIVLFLSCSGLLLVMGCGPGRDEIEVASANSGTYEGYDCSDLLSLGKERDFEMGTLFKTMRSDGVEQDFALFVADTATFGVSSLVLGDGVEDDYVNRFGQLLGEYKTIGAIMTERGCSEVVRLRGSKDIVESVELF